MDQARTSHEGERALFRCLKVARWVVVVLIIYVIALASAWVLQVAFRPTELYIMIARGSVGVHGPSPDDMTANFTLRLCNPSAREGRWFANVTFELFGNSTSVSPGQRIISFPFPPDTWVGKQQAVDVPVEAGQIRLPPEEFASSSIIGGTMKIEGLVQTRITGLRHPSGYHVRYYCRPLSIGQTKAAHSTDVSCDFWYIGGAFPPSICSSRHRDGN